MLRFEAVTTDNLLLVAPVSDVTFYSGAIQNKAHGIDITPVVRQHLGSFNKKCQTSKFQN